MEDENYFQSSGWWYISHEEIPGIVVPQNSGNPGSVVVQAPRFLGGVGAVFQLPSMGRARIFFTETTLNVRKIVQIARKGGGN